MMDTRKIPCFLIATSFCLVSGFQTASAATVTYTSANTSATSAHALGRDLEFSGTGGAIFFMEDISNGSSQPYDPTDVTGQGTPGLQMGFQLTDPTGPASSSASPSELWDVTSFTIDQNDNAARNRIGDITVFYGNAQSETFSLADNQGAQTFNFASTVRTSYMLIAVTSTYVGTDRFIGIQEFSFEGTQVSADSNANAAATMTSAQGTGGFDVPSRAADGAVDGNGIGEGTYLNRTGAGQAELTATYSGAQTVASIGLGHNWDSNGNRVMPTRIEVIYDSGSEFIDLLSPYVSYGRYNLAASVSTTSLTVRFPDGTSATDWLNDGGSQEFGITEFQAFDTPQGSNVIPEPASFALTMAGLTLILSRRRR